MLYENIKRLRIAKGLSQEELATRLNVVRQTISKWEKGLSVPDSEILIKLSDVLKTTVSELLEEETKEPQPNTEIAEQLARINEQLRVRNSKSKKLAKILLLTVISIFAIMLIWIILGSVADIQKSTSETFSNVLPI